MFSCLTIQLLKRSLKTALILQACLVPCLTAAEPTDVLLQVPIGEVDLTRDNSTTLSDIRDAFVNFMTRRPVVRSAAPDFTLTNLNGRTISLHDFRGKSPVLIVFGSSTCYVYRRNAMKRTDELRRGYESTGTNHRLEVLVIYTLEAHPAIDPSPYTGFQWTTQANVEDRVLIRQPTTLEQRRRNAEALAARYDLDRGGIVVDRMDNATWRAYGEMPNELYLINKDGSVVYKEVWAHLTADNPGAKPPAMKAIANLLGQS